MRILPAGKLGLILLSALTLLLSAGAARAEWVLYDDFDLGSLDSSKWFELDESGGAVTRSIVGGKLRISTVGEGEYLLVLDDLPEGATGLKADVRLVSCTGGMTFQLEYRVDGGQDTFGTETMMDTVARFQNQLGTYGSDTWYGVYNLAAYTKMAVDNYELQHQFGKTQVFLNDDKNGTHVLATQVSNTHGYFQTAGSRSTLYQKRTDDGSMNNKRLRLKFYADAEATGTFEIDNVYVHVGDMEMETSSPPKVVVVPMF